MPKGAAPQKEEGGIESMHAVWTSIQTANNLWAKVMNAWTNLHGDISILISADGDKRRELLGSLSGVNKDDSTPEDVWQRSWKLLYGSLVDISRNLKALQPFDRASRWRRLHGTLETIASYGRIDVFHKAWMEADKHTDDGDVVDEWPAVKILSVVQASLEDWVSHRSVQYQKAGRQFREHLEAFGHTAFPQLREHANQLHRCRISRRDAASFMSLVDFSTSVERSFRKFLDSLPTQTSRASFEGTGERTITFDPATSICNQTGLFVLDKSWTGHGSARGDTLEGTTGSDSRDQDTQRRPAGTATTFESNLTITERSDNEKAFL
jgi:hypothetical protein